MKTYIIVGDNNYWYATFRATERKALFKLKTIAKDILKGVFDDGGEGSSELYLFEASEISRLKI